MGGSGDGQIMVTETVAGHVLAAVCDAALFVLMGRRQLDALIDAPAEAAVPYGTPFDLARDHFVRDTVDSTSGRIGAGGSALIPHHEQIRLHRQPTLENRIRCEGKQKVKRQGTA
jgi:hypothetical protein